MKVVFDLTHVLQPAPAVAEQLLQAPVSKTFSVEHERQEELEAPLQVKQSPEQG